MNKTTKISLLIAFVVMASNFAFTQDKDENAEKKEGYQFTEDIRLDCSPVKNQYRSGTCWSYSGLSFLESELINNGQGEYNLSEAFIVWNTYSDKADKYVRFHGSLNFGGGGAFHDVTEIIKEHGIVPEEAFDGLVIGEEYFVHGEMDKVLQQYVEGVVENKNKKLTPVWHNGFESLLDVYIGPYPNNFTYDEKEFTPQSFAEHLGLNMDDYIEIGSYTHHPFYEKFILEVPDNWMLDEIYNLPLDEMMDIIDESIKEGHTIAWGADISEKGFSWKNGVAVVPDEDKPDLSGTEKEKWESLTSKEQAKMLYSFDEPVAEKEITQELRQEGFDNYTTTDDHGMEIVGIARDQNGSKYYIIKNSWGTQGYKYDGFFYASEAFVRYKTIDIMVNKNVIPKHLKKKMGI
ncbi:MAG: aminopeptidase [Desulfobacterales bacterium]|nr:aminopeptidase [Desulfobacterales bacterium]